MSKITETMPENGQRAQGRGESTAHYIITSIPPPGGSGYIIPTAGYPKQLHFARIGGRPEQFARPWSDSRRSRPCSIHYHTHSHVEIREDHAKTEPKAEVTPPLTKSSHKHQPPEAPGTIYRPPGTSNNSSSLLFGVIRRATRHLPTLAAVRESSLVLFDTAMSKYTKTMQDRWPESQRQR